MILGTYTCLRHFHNEIFVPVCECGCTSWHDDLPASVHVVAALLLHFWNKCLCAMGGWPHHPVIGKKQFFGSDRNISSSLLQYVPMNWLSDSLRNKPCHATNLDLTQYTEMVLRQETGSHACLTIANKTWSECLLKPACVLQIYNKFPETRTKRIVYF